MNGHKHQHRTAKQSLKVQVKGLSQKATQPPGVGRYIGDSSSQPFSALLVSYDEHMVVRQELKADSAFPSLDPKKLHWLQVRGLTAEKPIEHLCQMLELHPLSIEDIFNTYHPPKFEELADYLLLISKCHFFKPETKSLNTHHLALVLKGNLLLTFLDDELNLFDPILERLESGLGRIRKMSIDYLFYRLVDHILDQNFVTIDAIWDLAEALDQAIINGPDKSAAGELQHLKREMIHFMKSLRPLRQSISGITQSVTPCFLHETRLYFRDLQDNVVEITEWADTLNAYLVESYNLYLSVLGQKTNEVMKILTAIATIFIPLTFLVGIYGMNFKNMPELQQPAAYPLLWLFMILLSVVMYRYFKRNKWF